MIAIKYKPYDPHEHMNEVRELVKNNQNSGVILNVHLGIYRKVDQIWNIWKNLHNNYEVPSN